MTDPKKIDLYASQKLRVLRATSGISQAALGREAGLSFQQIQKYERGSNRMSAGRVFQFARLFDVSVRIFFPESDDVPFETIPPATLRFLRCLNRIPPEFHEDVLVMLRMCARIAGGRDADD